MENEDQQVEQIKQFIKEYGPWVVAGLAIGFGSLFGWRYYQDNQLQAAQQRTATLQDIVEVVQFADADTDLAAVQAQVAELGSSEQGALAHLQLAGVAAKRNELEQAKEHLQAALAATRVAELRSIINVRLARIAIAEENFTAAEQYLNAVSVAAFTGLVSEVRGDLLVAQGDVAGAREAYALAAVNQGDAASPYLQMKIDNLAGR